MIGLVIAFLRTEGTVTVHRLEPVTNHSLRQKWKKIYIDPEGKETITPSEKPSTAKVEANAILEIVQLSKDGVMNAKASRRFDRQQWTFEKSYVEGAEPEQEGYSTFMNRTTTTDVQALPLLTQFELELEHRRPESTVRKVSWDPKFSATNYLEEEFVACMEIWPQGTPFYKVRGFSAA